MTFEDVELFIYALFAIIIVLVVVTAVLLGVIRGDFHRYSLVEPPKRLNVGDFYEKFVDCIRHIWPGI